MWGRVQRGQPAPRWEIRLENAGDVPVRYAPEGPGLGPVRNAERAERKEKP